MMLYTWYFLVLMSIISKSCLSASILSNSECPVGTKCVLTTSCPTVLEEQNAYNKFKYTWCGDGASGAKACCPLSDAANQFEAIKTETLKTNKRVDNEYDKIIYPTDSSTTYSYEMQSTESSGTTKNPFPNITVCGVDRPSDRIVGGQLADIDEFPWLGRILYKSRWGTLVYACGATLITDRYLVTAAHCLTQTKQQDYLSVRLGEWDDQTELDCQNNHCVDKPVDIDIEKVFFHKTHNKTDVTKADIALIKLKEAVKFTEFISPICVPTTEYVKMQVYAQDNPYVTAGWGLTEFNMQSAFKRKVSLNGVSSELCEKIYDKYDKSLFHKVICAGGVAGVDSCFGDSGGPLMKKVEEDYQTNWYLFGITSFGNRQCGAEGKPSIYTKVSVYMDWIQSIVST